MQPNNMTREEIAEEADANFWEKEILDQCMLNYAGFYDFTTPEKRREIYREIKFKLFVKGWILLHKFSDGKRFAHFVDKQHGTDSFFEKLSKDITVLEIGCGAYKSLREWVKYNLGFEQTEDEEIAAVCRLTDGGIVQIP